MKLTKKLEAEIRKAYHTIWDAYLKGDMKTFASMLDENCYIIGSAQGEIFNNKKSAVKYYKSTADQITGKAEFRNRKIHVMPADKGFMVNEESDFYLLIDDQWTYYGPGRISSLFHKKNNKWKVIHQHGSFPDSKTEGGEQVNTEKIKAENVQLRDAVKRRTVELEQKNRELEIESSLEKVRAQALGMHKPGDLLNVCKVLFKELSLLGFSEIRNAIIHTFNDDENYLIDYDYSDLIGGIITTIPYSDHPVIKRFLKQIRRSDEAFAEVTVKGKELNEWKKFRKSGGQPDDPRLDKTSALYYYLHSVGSADIGISTFNSISEEKLQLLKRFRNVFDLAYKRYKDITKAEEQAREAEIELALERVRARTMAMQKPSEFNEVIDVIGEQFVNLGFDIQWANFSASGLDVSTGLDLWLFAVIPGVFRSADRLFIPYAHHPIYSAIKDALKEHQTTGKDFFVISFDKTDKNSWLDHLHDTTTYQNLPPELIAMDYDKPGYTSSAVILKDTWLSVGKHDNVPFTNEQNAILKRFSLAFGQAHTRFLDLQKAEAQAREARIEAGLERVRSRAMAMQTSEELNELIGTVFTELTKLDFVLTRSVILIYEGNEKGVRWWMANSEAPSMPMNFFVKYADLPFFNAYLKGWEERSLKWQYILEGEDKITTDNFIFNETELSLLPDFVIAGMKANNRVYLSASFNNYGCLNLASVEPLSDEHFDILLRFAKVFDLTYTRFNDLKQAEAQARESQIQLALERVRARTMAMQKSDELLETSSLLFQQIKELGETAVQVSIGIINEEAGFVELSTTIRGSHLPRTLNVPIDDPYVMGKAVAAWRAKQKSLRLEMEGQELKEYNEWRNKFLETKVNFPEEHWIVNLIYFSKGWLSCSSDKNISDETFALLKRFAAVFEQTYIRFNDLKQAEAQGREAQIEAALERVRSSSLAMHKSEELKDVVKVVFDNFRSLGLQHIDAVNINIFHQDSRDFDLWLAAPGQDYTTNFRLPYLDHPIANDFFNAVEKGETIHKRIYDHDVKNKYFEYMFEYSDNKHLPGERKKLILNGPAYSVATGIAKHSSIFIHNYNGETFSEEASRILVRFSQVFDQAYTRFLDLQKAEAQAREAKIETALEKVRSRSLAMHKSEELQEVVNTVFERLQDLNVEMDSANIAIFKEGTRDYDYWIASPVQQRSASFHMPYFDLSLTRDITAARESGADFSAAAYSFEEKNKWFEYAYENTDFKFLNEERKQFILNAPAITVAIAFSKHTGVQINRYVNKLPSEGEIEVLKRFSKVFEQAYIRFLDLQKAEAQAHEARIEIALERIRARALAMHKSDELMEVAKVLREQMALLGQPELEASVVHLYEQDPDHIHSWRAVGIGGEAQTKLTYGHMAIPKNSCEVVREWVEKFHSELKEYTIEISGAKQKEWYDLLFKLAPDVINSMLEEKSIHEKRYYRFSKFSGGALLMVSKREPSEEVIYLQRRAAVVFDLAYRRFSDLQKAEAQARDAQIESSLERVRSKTMAMHNSQDVGDTVATMFDELVKLGIQTLRCGVGILHEGYQMDLWTAKPNETGKIELFVGHLDMKLHPLLKGGYENWKDKRDSYSYELKGDDLIAYFNVINNYSGYQAKYDIASLPSCMYHYEFNFNEGCLFSFSLDPLSAESSQIFKRFAGVFGQTYRRYLDLQKAEAQAREAQIEASLERVRSKTMAMHNSEDVGETVATMLDELVRLGVETVRCGIAIIDESKTMEVWTASSKEDGSVKLIIGQLDMSIHPLFRMVYDAWKNKVPVTTYELIGEDLKDYFRAVNNSPDYPIRYDIESLPYKQSNTAFMFPEGLLFVFSQEPLITETTQIFKRFAGVFGQTYRRYLDLQKAEAQAREAKIEASLERVRAKAMAMHQSDDLHGAVKIMFEEFQKLNLNVLRCGIGILNKDSRTGAVWTTSVSDNGLAVQLSANESFDTHPLMMLIYEHWQKQEDLDYVLQGQDLINYYRAMDESDLKLPKLQLSFSDDELQPQYYYGTMFNVGGLYSFRDKPFVAEDKKIMKRFASVVNLTYNRFLDLQKAEAQAREAKIEASLERVRAKAMAMHKSEDLNSAVATVFEELDKLDLGVLRCGISILDKEKRTGDIWVTSITDQGSAVQVSGDESFDIHPLLQGAFEAWVKKEDFYYLLEGDDLARYYKAVMAANFQLPESQLITSETEFKKQYCYTTPYGAGGLFAFRETEFPEEAKTVMKRFANVFDLTYKRFLDLQKAEANAREAKIEASLERVRAKAMAMHKTEDLNATVATVFEELQKLDLGVLRCGIPIFNKEEKTADVWTTSLDKGDAVQLTFRDESFEIHPLLQGAYEAWRKQVDFSYILQGEDIARYYKALETEKFHLPSSQVILSNVDLREQYYHIATFHAGGLFAFRDIEFSEEEKKVMKRFAGVFDLTYKRFLDLQKAEANAREAQIETGLERVRARTMAMHSSEDVSIATATMFTELEKLGIESFRGGILTIRADQTMDVWSVNNLAEGKIVRAAGKFDMTMHPFWQQLYKGWVNKDEVLYFNMSGKDKEDYVRILNARRDYLPTGMQELPDSHIQSYYFGEGFVWTFTLQPHSEEDKQVMKRFASVFSLTFRRYQDLLKAEAQAREATIEAALEKVRGKAMAMHNSNDLTATASLVFTELRKLGISPLRCGVGILNKENRKALLYSAVASDEGDNLSQFGWVLLDINPILKSIYDHWIGGQDYFPVLTKEMLKAYYAHLNVGFEVPDEHKEYEQYGYFIAFSEGMFYGWAERPFAESEIKILKRFASVIDLTFRRYMELQKSEANAREAVKQAALDRVRAEIASMRTVTDLERITPLIWNELTILGIAFIRCGVFIMDEYQQLIHTFLSTPDGKAIAAFHLPYDTPGNLSHVVSNWKVKKKYIDHWGQAEFIQFAEILMKQGALASAEQYLKTIPQGGFYLHFLPFLQGMLYVGNTTQLGEEEIELIQHVADAFSTAYARYEDFNKLEAAKQQVEKTLVDLKQAQTQLVQSEKMASLGELTAGIAHEIQNPLNFVNNFSDVSNELLEEMKIELEKGNAEDAMAIVEDVKQNLEKILHHGKRADAIVKGMLQHSRTSSGQKEPTDINVLADEYLRLSFHGLRAKDKSFNARFETKFDNSIGKINVIPQDIGRVILNLINNAFYAVTEKKKAPQPNGGVPYDPTVTVTTKKDNGKVEITVKDNGNGIPQKVLDKIFQPFFTTKPTGQGTGLGLSLSYDIVTKGHGGELKVETKEGEGSEFIIQIPVSKTPES